jgi:hypothetical protein
MSKGGGSQTVTQSVDPQTQAYVNQMRQLALGYAGISSPTAGGPGTGWAGFPGIVARSGGGTGGLPGVAPALPPGIQQAQQQYGQYANAGTQGIGALSGQPGAQAAFMNPYLSQMNPFFAQQRALAVQGANDQATQAGAFGGDRSQIGAAIAGNQADQTQAAFNYQGFQDAMQRALQASQLGFGAIGAGALLPQQYASGQLGLLQQALGPYGQTQTQPLYQNRGAGILGGAATGASMFGLPGAIGGGIIGSGIFG